MKKIIKPIKIGKISLENNLFLAPMEAFTNVAFRTNLLKLQKITVFTEMIPANPLSKDGNYCNHLLYRNENEILGYQFFGNKPEVFAKSVENTENLADFYNINLGCPVEKIISQGAGCALLKRKNRIYDIVKAMKKNTEKPITLKIRIGYVKKTHLDYDLLYSLGVDAIFIHARTCKQKYAGNIDLNYLKEAKEKSPKELKIIGNGDLHRFKEIKEMYEKTKIDGFMIGRAALHNPKVFKDIYEEKDYEKWATTLSLNKKIDFLKDYYNDLEKYNIKGAFVKVKTLSMFMLRYSKDAKKVRLNIIKTKDIKEFFSYLNSLR